MRVFSLSSLVLLSTSFMEAAAEKLLYRNNFTSSDDIAGWIPEGPVRATVSNNTLELSGAGGIDDHFVYWVPEVFPDRIRITWEFSPVQEPGLAMFFFGAQAVDGGSIFDKDLAPRNGSYAQYHSGDIRTLHASYFRRRWPEERAFHLANLRKSPGFHLVSQGADPLPPVPDAKGAFYKVEVVKDKRDVRFSVNGLLLFSWEDVERSTGPVVRDGRIGLRQMNPLVARYRNLEDEWVFDSKRIDHKQHAAVIKILLDNRADPDDLGVQPSYPIQIAVELCPKPVVKLLIEAGTDLNLAGGDDSSLYSAAGREVAAAEIVNMLLEEGTDIPSDEAGIQELLEQPLQFFVGDVSRNQFNGNHVHPDGHFSSSPSLEYVFKYGPGAVLRILMTVFPQLRATKVEYGLVLQIAAFLNDHIFVDLLISRGVDVNAAGYHYGTALQAASRWGHEDIVMRLLQAGAQVNFLQGRWQTALRAAIAGGHEQVVRILLEHGADIQLAFKTDPMAFPGRESRTQTALQLAVRTDKVGVVQILLAAGADVSGDESETLQGPRMMVDQHPLILSCQQGNAAMVHALLDAGAPVNVTGTTPPWHGYFDAEYASPLHAAVKAEHTHVVRILLSRGANVDKTAKECSSALILAAKSGNRAMTRLLIEAKANVNYVTDSRAALTSAVDGGHHEIVQDLLAAGAAVEVVTGIPKALVRARGRSEDTRTIELLVEAILSTNDPEVLVEDAFSEVIRDCNLRMMRTLLEHVPATKTRFFQACIAGFEPFVKRMLETGTISLNEPGDEGNSPLCVSALHLKPAIVRLLVGHGAELNSIGEEFGTPLMMALTSCAARRLAFSNSKAANKLSSSLQSRLDNTWMPEEDSRIPRVGSRSLRRCEEIVGVLLDNGAGLVNATGPFGLPLHLACLTGSKTVVQRILGEGADVNETGGYFQHALFAALAIQRPDIVAVLLEHGANARVLHPDFGSPLHLAGSLANIASVQELLRHGANASAEDADGRSPREVAESMMEARQQWKGDHTKLRFRDDLLSILRTAERTAVLST